ncbi:hypothetical protein BDR26DRAFT_905491 [Obelidium mucronatum]|nr:hypothetical protein BDR26DRAFT_905491 [Obelidium mucronatum]
MSVFDSEIDLILQVQSNQYHMKVVTISLIVAALASAQTAPVEGTACSTDPSPSNKKTCKDGYYCLSDSAGSTAGLCRTKLSRAGEACDAAMPSCGLGYVCCAPGLLCEGASAASKGACAPRRSTATAILTATATEVTAATSAVTKPAPTTQTTAATVATTTKSAGLSLSAGLIAMACCAVLS